MSLTYRRVNPLDHATSIKRLFVEQNRPEFPDWFDRAYPVLVGKGGSSWVAIDAAGAVQLHIATFPVQLNCRGLPIKAVLLSNLTASAPHRSFLPAAGLLRRAVAGMNSDGVDLVYAPPGNDGALDRRWPLHWAAGSLLDGPRGAAGSNVAAPGKRRDIRPQPGQAGKPRWRRFGCGAP